MTFTILKNEKGFYWHLTASNGLKVAWAGEFYNNKSDCEHGIALLRQGAPGAQLVDNTRSMSSWG